MKKHLPHFLLVAASLFLLPTSAQAAKLEDWQYDANRNQLEFKTDQDVQPTAQLISDPTRLVIDLPGIVLGRPSFTQPVNDGAIRSVRFGQFDRQTMRIVVELAPGYTLDPNQVRFRGLTARQWSVQIPTPVASGEPSSPVLPGGSTATNPDVRPGTRPTFPPPTSSVATIESVSLEGNQLVVRSDQPLRYRTSWEMSTGFYRITVDSAQLAKSIAQPRLPAASPVRELKFRQEDARTVAILVKPAAGVQIVGLSQIGRQQLALQLQPRGTTPVSPPSNPIGTIPVPTPPRPTTPPPVNPPVPNGRVVVIVDPGHGGPDPGAIGIGGIQEKDIVLDIATKVADLLEKQGIQAVLTRRDDIDLDLEPRVQMAERLNATVFVSIHANAINATRSDVNGLETYYYDSGLQLAQTIHNSILQSIDIPDRRVRSARFYVLRRTSMPAVLVETGFVTGRQDAAKLGNPAYRSQMAAAITRGILQYLGRAVRN